MSTRTTKAKASIGVVTVLMRYKVLKNGDFSKTTTWTDTVWVTCDDEDEWHDISNAGGCHEKLSNDALREARVKYPKDKGWRVSASESWAVDPPRKSTRRRRR